MEKCPTHFYRYRSLQGDSVEFVERTVRLNELYFPSPSSFNDPFDCRPTFSFEAPPEEMERYYSRLWEKYCPELGSQQRQNEVDNMLKDTDEMRRREHAAMQMHVEKITRRIGVLCLSEVHDDILMWSHYADSHRGICFEFNGYLEFFGQAQEVAYSAERPKINPIRDSQDEMLSAALLTKAQHWSYEKEWRLIQYRNGPGSYQFPEGALTGIILGAQISEASASMIAKWIDVRECKPKLYRAAVDSFTFALNINEVRS